MHGGGTGIGKATRNTAHRDRSLAAASDTDDYIIYYFIIPTVWISRFAHFPVNVQEEGDWLNYRKRFERMFSEICIVSRKEEYNWYFLHFFTLV